MGRGWAGDLDSGGDRGSGSDRVGVSDGNGDIDGDVNNDAEDDMDGIPDGDAWASEIDVSSDRNVNVVMLGDTGSDLRRL